MEFDLITVKFEIHRSELTILSFVFSNNSRFHFNKQIIFTPYSTVRLSFKHLFPNYFTKNGLEKKSQFLSQITVS